MSRRRGPSREVFTTSERSTYQSMLALGYSRQEATDAALDGVDVETVRRKPRKMQGRRILKSWTDEAQEWPEAD